MLCHPGASFATAEYFTGYGNGLAELGVTLYPYRLDAAIEACGDFAKWYDRKHGTKTPGARTMYEASVRLLEAALRRNVDWVIVVSAMLLHPDALALMRRAGLKIALVLTESPYDDDAQALVMPWADLVTTNERLSVETLRAHNPNTHYQPAAYDPHRHVLTVAPPGTPRHDVVFVGTGFEERIELLSRVDWTGIDLGLYGTWSGLGSRSRLRQYVRAGPIHNDQTTNLYAAARIGLNLHRISIEFGRRTRKIEAAESLNPRGYELAACGVFQISDFRAEVAEVFGESVPTFGSAGELEALVRDALARPEWRRQCADEARGRVAPHTYTERAKALLGHLTRREVAA